MATVEFQARVENGVIVVPEEYQQELAEANIVKIIVLTQPNQQTAQPDILDELAQNPISVPGIRSLTRDQIHDRRSR